MVMAFVSAASALDVWGQRTDHELGREELVRDGFSDEADPDGSASLSPPAEGTLVPLRICDRTYIFVWGRAHVVRGRELVLAKLAFERRLPAPDDKR